MDINEIFLKIILVYLIEFHKSELHGLQRV